MPNIHETIKQLSIEAGGPGSGRKPGFGSMNKSMLNNMHKHLTSDKFEYKGSKAQGADKVSHHYKLAAKNSDSKTAEDMYIHEDKKTGDHFVNSNPKHVKTGTLGNYSDYDL